MKEDDVVIDLTKSAGIMHSKETMIGEILMILLSLFVIIMFKTMIDYTTELIKSLVD
jgi:hypothetical protein